MRDDGGIAIHPAQKVAGLVIDHHGVGARDALNQCIVKARGAIEERRKTDMPALVVDEPGPGAVKARGMRRQGLQGEDAALELVGKPEVILVTKCVVVSFYVLIADQGHEVFAKAVLRAFQYYQLRRAKAPLVGVQDFERGIGGTIVRNVERPL